jgi:nucleoside-diphosphate-sugar epimerase
MKICIIGHSGKIGTYLLNSLKKFNCTIHIISQIEEDINNQNVFIHKGDIRKRDIDFKNFLNNCDIFLNLVGEFRDEKNMENLNVIFFNELIEKCLYYSNKFNKKIHFVHISSCSVFGYTNQSRVLNENSQKKPNTLYGITKLQSEDILLKNINNNLFTFAILRPSAIIFNNDNTNSFNMLIKLLKFRFVIFFGYKDHVLNYVHIEDVIDAILLLAFDNNAKNQTFNLSNDTKLEQVINALKIINKDKYIIYIHSKLFSNIFMFIRKILKSYILLPDVRVLTYRTHYDSNKIQDKLNFKFKKKVPDFIANLKK